MSVIIEQNPPRKTEKVGLRDCGHIALACSKCGKPVAYVWVLKEDRTKDPWKVTAECCYGCKRSDGSPERSFIEEVPGRFSFCGYHKKVEDNPDEVIPITDITNQSIELDVVVIGTKKHEN